MRTPSMIGRIAIGLLIAILGGAIIYYTPYLTENFGPMQWAQKYLGSTQSGYVAFGFLVIIIGLLIAFGVLSGQSISDPGSLQQVQP